MNPTRLTVRFPATSAPEDLSVATEVFHRFIQYGSVEGLVLDVADYRHVPGGPGILLVGHEVDYGVSPDAFTVVRKRRLDDDAAVQLRDALRMGLGALAAIEHDGKLGGSYDRSRFTVSVADRKLGSRDELGAALATAVTAVVKDVHGVNATVTLAASDDPRRAPEVQVEVPTDAPGDALERLGGAKAAGQSAWDIPVDELARLREEAVDFTLVDVREPSEYETVNLGGKLIPLAALSEHLGDLDRDGHVVVHCRAGWRGAKAVSQLRQAGFSNAWNVNGGLMAWIDRVDPSLPRY